MATFQLPKKLKDQALHRLQRGFAFALATHPTHVRDAIGHILQEMLLFLQKGDTVEAYNILVRLLPAPSPSSAPTETLSAMIAREPLVPSLFTDPLPASNTVMQFDSPPSEAA